MLVLTRHSGESIRIGNTITLRVIKCQNGQVRRKRPAIPP
ncbi:MAG: carbon storage regulator [Thiopseudomonas sp.]|nr:carbon storage regulator [Thiopseudomonas sp.]